MPQRLDEIDKKILRILKRDARIANNALSERVGLSPTPCWQRVKRLEKDGYIQGYAAILDPGKLDRPETVIIEVSLERHDDRMLEAFGKAMASMAEVLEVYLVTGGYDYFIKVAVSGTSGYERFLVEKLYKVPGIRQSRSVFALRCLKKEISIEP